MTEEIWRDISGYEGHYQVSNFGRVKKLYKSVSPLILKPTLNNAGRGYLYVSLWRNAKHKKRLIHRLVAEAFIPNPDEKPEVNHIDGNPRNNHVDNLEWCTQLENIRHAYATGLIPQGEDHKQAKLTNAQVVYIRENPDKLTCVQLGKMFKVQQSAISAIQLGKIRKQAGGHIRESKHTQLSESDIREIRQLYKPYNRDFGTRALARKFGCAHTTIRHIVNEK